MRKNFGRKIFCATWRKNDVAQVSNLLYRRFATCGTSAKPTDVRAPGRLQTCGTADCKSALRRAQRAYCVLAVFLCLALISCSKKSDFSALKPPADNSIPVTVAVVKTIPMDRTLPIVGTLFAKDEATVAAQVEGQVEKTKVDFGDRVITGQELALIDTKTYEALAQQAEANLAKANANATNTEQNLARALTLQKEKISPQSELDKATADAGQAQADIKAAQAALVIAKLNLEHSHVRAPFDGAIAERIASAGDYMKIGTPLFRIVNDSVLKYIVQAPESYAGLVKKEQPVAFTVDAFPTNQFEGKVFLISPQVNTTTRAFAFGALVQNPERKLRANTFARGELILETDVPTQVVPLDAVMNFAGVTKIFVVENGVAHARDVQVGRVKNGFQEILVGLKPAENVVLTGQTKLHDGSKVQVKTNAAPEKISATNNASDTSR